jgi:hypothetical protein
MHDDIAAQLEVLAQEAARLEANLETYWVAEGVSELGIFIDPDLYQYLDKLYHESRAFAVRCQGLAELARQVRAG